ncbi:MAG: polyketide synthase, partial [Rubricoccaceae bacterium]|nr:polyketide synthase [Rubricoccaceae bacterium]
MAIVGMACRFPDAPDVETFWKNLCHGHESVRAFSYEDLRKKGLSDELLNHPNYVRKGVVLDGIDQFDAGFFGFSPRDASIMDPQNRVFLECAWEALEHAGYDPGRTDAAIGIFAGCGMNAYMMYNLLSNPGLMASSGEFLIRHTGNDKDFLTTRVSYELDLKGPSVNVQTACSTSLVAVHLAMQSLLLGESDMALAGGVTISLDQEKGYLYQPGEILSPDGHCRSFDKDSRGTIFGSGAGLVVLKRLSDALADDDSIHGVLLGSAVN